MVTGREAGGRLTGCVLLALTLRHADGSPLAAAESGGGRHVPPLMAPASLSLPRGSHSCSNAAQRQNARQGHVCCGSVLTLAIDPSSPDVVYAGNGYGAFRSVDGGATWERTGLSRLNVEALVVDPAQAHTLYAGTWGGAGVYRSTDAGSTWMPFDDGLPAGVTGGLSLASGVGSLALSPDGRRLLAGTLGSGVVARALPR